jgi:hypothetical protein
MYDCVSRREKTKQKLKKERKEKKRRKLVFV